MNFIVNILTAYVIAVVYLFASTSPAMGGSGALNGASCAFWLWLGFFVTSTSIDVTWTAKPKRAWLFEIGAALIVYSVMGAVIASV